LKCLCCGKEITSLRADEIDQSWHNSCVRKFFGVDRMPKISIEKERLVYLANESTNKGYTVPGVQKKLSLHLSDIDSTNPRLTLVDYPSGYILKPQTDNYAFLPESEFCVMKMAVITGIKTVPFALIKLSGEDSEYAYITKRVDRRIKYGKNSKVELFAMEDFCQLDGRLTEDKYGGSYERCAKIIDRYSQFSGMDKSELFLRLVFCFAVGNSDMHLKNFSLVETDANSQKYVLSPAYDLLPVNIVIPEDQEQTALTLNGKKRNIRRNDFLKYAKAIDLNEKAAVRMIDKVISLENDYLEICNNSMIGKEMKEKLSGLIADRISCLRGSAS